LIRLGLLGAGLALALTVPAAGQNIQPVEELVPFLAHDFCLDVLDGAAPDPWYADLRALGFSGDPVAGSNPVLGSFESVVREAADGDVHVTVAIPGFCRIIVAGSPAAERILGGLKNDLADFDFSFSREAEYSYSNDETVVETYRADLEPGAVLRVSFFDSLNSTTPHIAYQISTQRD
jgi:hypothetical protein